MAQKVAKLGIERDNQFLYYIKSGDVWRVPRKQPGVRKKAAALVAETEAQMESGFIYFLDKSGDVARVKAKVGGQPRKKSKAKKATRAVTKPSTAKKAKSSGKISAKRKASAAKPAKKPAKKAARKRR